MEVRLLQYFLAVARHRSFSKAAAALSVPQPTLSRHIKTLEDHFGAALLFRDGRGVTPTEAGLFLQARSEALLKSLTEIEHGISAIVGNPGGVVEVAFPSTICAGLGVALLQQVRRTHPHIIIKFQEGTCTHVLEWLTTGRADVAIICNPPKTSTLSVQPLIEEEFMLFSSAARPPLHVTTAGKVDLQGLPVAFADAVPSMRQMLDRYVDNPDKIEVLELGSLRATIDFVCEGFGLTILPLSCVTPEVAEGRLTATRLGTPAPQRHVTLATSSQRPIAPATLAVAQALTILAKAMLANRCLPPVLKPALRISRTRAA